MAPVGKADAMVGCVQPVVVIVISDGDTGGPVVWSGVLGAVGRGDEGCGEY